MKWLWEHIKIMFAGVMMVVSDAVPGFSGGIGLTITGRLHQVWGSWNLIKSPKKKGDRSKGVLFYTFFLTGSVSGTFGFAQIISLMLNNIPAITFWFFICLSISSLFIYRKVNKKDIYPMKGLESTNEERTKRKAKRSPKKAILSFACGMLLISGLALYTFLAHGRTDVAELRNANGNVGLGHIEATVMIMLGGFFASPAMVTPGMSGAIVLLVFGAYGNLYSGLYAHPAEHPWVLVMYILSSAAGTITSVVVLDKAYKKWPFTISWFFYGTILASIGVMVWIFDVFVPVDVVRWGYIPLTMVCAFSLGAVTYKYVKPHD